MIIKPHNTKLIIKNNRYIFYNFIKNNSGVYIVKDCIIKGYYTFNIDIIDLLNQYDFIIEYNSIRIIIDRKYIDIVKKTKKLTLFFSKNFEKIKFGIIKRDLLKNHKLIIRKISVNYNTDCSSDHIYNVLEKCDLHNKISIKSPLISIIITAYNSENTIKRCLKSILYQSYNNLEIIVIDDKSTDKTGEMISEIKKADKRVRHILNNINVGTYCSKNFGIHICNGEYITFLDSDDWLSEDHIQCLYYNYISSNVKVVYSKYKQYEPNLNHIKINRGHPITSFFNKKLIQDIGYFDSVRVAADNEFKRRIEKKYGNNSILTIDKYTLNYTFNFNPYSLSNLVKWKNLARQEYIMSYKLWHLKSNNLYIPFPINNRPFNLLNHSKKINVNKISLSNFKEI